VPEPSARFGFCIPLRRIEIRLEVHAKVVLRFVWVGHDGAECVLDLVVIVGGFDVADEGGAEDLLAEADGLQCDVSAVEDGHGLESCEPVGTAVDVECIRHGYVLASFERNLVCGKADDAALTYNVSDFLNLLEFGDGQGCACL